MIFIFFYMTLFTVTLISDTILTFFEIWILKTSYEVENFKYVKLLKFLEICSVIIFFITKLSIFLTGITIITFAILCFITLIYDFCKKKINKRDFEINFIFFLIDPIIMCSMIVVAFMLILLL